MGSDHPSFSVQQLEEGSPSCREDSEKGEGIADFAWSVLAVDVQDLSHIVPHDDVYAVDDPNDWLVSDDPRHIHWTSIDPPDSVPLDDRTQNDLPRAQMDDGAQVTCTNDRTLLHNYRAYGPGFPCPIRLKPAVRNAAVHPIKERSML
jgi:hypothetical protein